MVDIRYIYIVKIIKIKRLVGIEEGLGVVLYIYRNLFNKDDVRFMGNDEFLVY